MTAHCEIVDTDSFNAAFGAGTLRGVALDVDTGEFEGPPDRRLSRESRLLNCRTRRGRR
jgi:hypothetical protein